MFRLGNENQDISVTLQRDFACSTSRSPQDGIRVFGNVLPLSTLSCVSLGKGCSGKKNK